jgi:acetyl esterase/lipase
MSRLKHSDARLAHHRISSRSGRRGSLRKERGAGAAISLVALLLVLAPVPERVREVDVGGRAGGHLTPRSSLRDLLNHPAFAGFGDLLLPWDDRAYDQDMPLSDIGSLLPYHSHVEPETVTTALNRMIDDVGAGQTVFYRFYTEAQRRDQPTQERTGLFYLRGRPGAPFAVICPGGGFSYVGSVHEGFPYAAEISRRGYNAFVLRYRAGRGAAVAIQDLAAAISYIFQNAKMLGVSTSDYSLWGSSAGARMAAAIGSHGVAAHGGGNLPRPAVIVMAYTAHSDHSSDEPPTFVVVGDRDGIAPPSTMERRVAALRRSGTDVEFRRYPDLGHGFGPGVGTIAEGWIKDATRFWERFMRKRN